MPLVSKRGAFSSSAGPQLPRSLTRELGGEPPVSFGVGGRGRGRGGGRRGSFQSDRGRGSFSSRGRSAPSPAGRFDRQRGRGGGGSLLPRGEKRRLPESQAGSSRHYESTPLDRPRRRSKTLFSTLLDKKEQVGTGAAQSRSNIAACLAGQTHMPCPTSLAEWPLSSGGRTSPPASTGEETGLEKGQKAVQRGRWSRRAGASRCVTVVGEG